MVRKIVRKFSIILINFKGKNIIFCFKEFNNEKCDQSTELLKSSKGEACTTCFIGCHFNETLVSLIIQQWW